MSILQSIIITLISLFIFISINLLQGIYFVKRVDAEKVGLKCEFISCNLENRKSSFPSFNK